MAQASVAATDSKGLDRALWNKIAGKLDPVRLDNMMQWIYILTNEQPPADDHQQALKDGYLLSKCLFVIEPNIKTIIKKKRWKPKRTSQPFPAREQISLFLRGCTALGVKNTDLFTAQDLFNEENLNNVVNCVYALNAVAKNRGFAGPFIVGAFTHAVENRRDFTEEQLRAGQHTLSTWEQGSVRVKGGPQLDSQGIVKTAGNEEYKATTGTGKWSTGSVARETGNNLDSAGIVKTAGNTHQATTGTGVWSQGSVARSGGPQLDSAGIVKNAGNETYRATTGTGAWSQGSRTGQAGNNYDGVGIVRQPNSN